jgi:uncharacterized protein (TIGR02145 family)
MQVVLQNGQVELHQIIEIDSVTFATTPNPLAHSCGADSVHNPALTYGSMTDQEGNVYKTIVIGSQEWMAENLKTNVYRNGEIISNINSNNEWAVLTTGAWCYLNNNSLNLCPYGKLYNWYAVADERNLCPTGWHIPTDIEWSTLINFLDPSANGGNTLPNNAGSKMKSVGELYFVAANQDATNESGFGGLPGGVRFFDGPFIGTGNTGGWWSSTENGPINIHCRDLNIADTSARRVGLERNGALSVRCVRD